MSKKPFSLKRIAARLRDESGAALVCAVGVMAVGTMTGVTVLDYSVQNAGSAGRSTHDQYSYGAAEAGVNNALAVLANPANDPLNGSLLSGGSSTYERSSAVWSGTLDRANGVWTLTSEGQTRNPTGPRVGAVRRRMTVKVPVVPVYTEATANAGWDYVFATRTGLTCDENVNANVVVTAPMYVNGNMCLASGARVTAGPLVVRGRLTLSAESSAVGSSGSPISEAHIGAGCKYWDKPLHDPCSSVDNVWANVLDRSPQTITPPTPAWDSWYRAAAPGPAQPCTSSTGSVPVFENETTSPTRNNSVTTSFSLTPAASYSCRVGPADAPFGELSWDAGRKVLTVKGTVFIDGSAKVDNGALNTYEGHGTLYLSGTMLFSSKSKLCAAATATECDWGGWNPASNFLVVVTNGTGGQVMSGNGVQLSGEAQFQGALYATYTVYLSSYAKAQGPMVGNTIGLASTSELKPWPSFETSPVGLPGNRVVTGRLGTPGDYSG